MNALTLMGRSGDCFTNTYFPASYKNDRIGGVGTRVQFQQITKGLVRLISNISGGYDLPSSVFYDCDDIVDFFPEDPIYGNAFRAIDGLCQSPWNYSEHTPNAPSMDHVKTAKAGLLKLAANNLPEPEIMLLDDGTLGAFWYTQDNRYVSIDFEDDNFIWGINDENGTEVGEFRVTGDIPDKIISLFKK